MAGNATVGAGEAHPAADPQPPSSTPTAASPPALPLPEPQPARRPLSRGTSIIGRAVLGLVLLVVVALGSAWLMYASIDPTEERLVSSGQGRAALSSVRSWGYQLQRVDIAQAAKSPLDLLVVDETVDGVRRTASTGDNLARLKRKPTGERRLVLSYLSIGEAEEYRPYWKSGWVRPRSMGTPVEALSSLPTIGPTPARASIKFSAPLAIKPLNAPAEAAPAWLGDENPEWRGNFRVRYWHPDWQRLMFGSPAAAIDRIVAAGFDGVYLDRADVYGLWSSEQPTAKTDMVQLIEKIASYARRQNPEFLVVMQNAEELLSASHLRTSLDAVAKEDLLFGVEGGAKANSKSDVAASLHFLQLARRDGLPILVVEYLDEHQKMDEARRRIQSEGFIPYFGPRALNALGRAG